MRTLMMTCLIALGCDVRQDLGRNGDGGCNALYTDCNGTCVRLGNDPANCGRCGSACASPNVCSYYECVAQCPQGLTKCGGSCTNLGSDDANCGACGAACAPGQHCGNNQCFSCAPGNAWCVVETPNGVFGACADLASDNNHCGSCGVRCATVDGLLCRGGACVPM